MNDVLSAVFLFWGLLLFCGLVSLVELEVERWRRS